MKMAHLLSNINILIIDNKYHIFLVLAIDAVYNF